ncbi:MAG: hypothetical protein AAGA05_12220 [Pseudomonadota bacterium]
MHRKFIALIVSTAIAITAFGTAPARAQGEDVAKIIAGLAALALIARAVEKANDDDDDRSDRHVTHNHYNYKRRSTPNPRPLPKAVSNRVLPAECLRRVDNRSGRYRILGRECISNRWGNPDRLPSACAARISTSDGLRRGYRPQCLRNHGYRIVLR